MFNAICDNSVVCLEKENVLQYFFLHLCLSKIFWILKDVNLF